MKRLILCFSLLVILAGCGLNKGSEYIEPQLYESYYNVEQTVDENIAQALKEANLSDVKYDTWELTDNPNKIIILEAKSNLKNVFVYPINQVRFEALNYDIDALIKENEKIEPVIMGENLQTNDVIVMLCIEPDTIPIHYIGWTAEDKTVEYHVIQFNGKGE